ncbi:hypothetical protein BJX63DRAFT_258123 [Aspergillus granulosus]|uniref:Uncharacterized protein n=1 Tax=Aspergillus granulosus TaxID=176169 RepID=A0ABR4I090_9EURO
MPFGTLRLPYLRSTPLLHREHRSLCSAAGRNIFPLPCTYSVTLNKRNMSGLRFSVGDIIAAIKLVGTVTDALRESSHASTSFRSLIHELYALERAPPSVKQLDLGESQEADKITLQRAR